MDNPGYVGLMRMAGLADELRVVANNVANASTTGYRGEAVVFAEVLAAADVDGGVLSMAAPSAHATRFAEGGFAPTGGTLDLAIEGDAFFRVQTPQGVRLTRAGAFRLDAEGQIVNPDGHALLDEGGAPIAVPADAGPLAVAPDGTISADGRQIAVVGLVTAVPASLAREGGVLFAAAGETPPAESARVLQGFVEQSNVEPVSELARLVEVQRAYELGQSFLDLEDDRLREAVRTLGRIA